MIRIAYTTLISLFIQHSMFLSKLINVVLAIRLVGGGDNFITKREQRKKTLTDSK